MVERGAEHVADLLGAADLDDEVIDPLCRRVGDLHLRFERGIVAADDDVGAEHVAAQELAQLAADDRLPLTEHRHAIADRLDVGEDVSRKEDRPPLAAIVEDEIADLFSTDRVEPAHRLVEDQKLGIGDERSGETGALEHAFREPAGLAICRVRDAGALERRERAGAEIGAAEARERAAHLDELSRGDVRVDVRVLGEKADSRARAGGANRFAEEGRLSARRRDEARQHLDRRRLAGAVRTDEPEDLAAGDVEGH